MGYLYNNKTGALCCDACGLSNNVKKRRCPYGYCIPSALCNICFNRETIKGYTKKAHKDCLKRSKKMQERENKRKQLLLKGKPVRSGAMLQDNNIVHVLFDYASGNSIGYYMEREVYNAIPLLTPTIPEDYAKLGQLKLAPDHF